MFVQFANKHWCIATQGCQQTLSTNIVNKRWCIAAQGCEEDLNDFCRLLNNLTAKEGLGLTQVKLDHPDIVISISMVIMSLDKREILQSNVDGASR